MLCIPQLDTHLTWNLYPAPPLSGTLLPFNAESCLQISCIETKGQDDQKIIPASHGIKLHMQMQLVVIRNPCSGCVVLASATCLEHQHQRRTKHTAVSGFLYVVLQTWK